MPSILLREVQFNFETMSETEQINAECLQDLLGGKSEISIEDANEVAKDFLEHLAMQREVEMNKHLGWDKSREKALEAEISKRGDSIERLAYERDKYKKAARVAKKAAIIRIEPGGAVWTDKGYIIY